MEVKEKVNRFGSYYRVTATLLVEGKQYKIIQTTRSPQKMYSQWDLTRSQMISILRNTKPEDWLFRSKGHWDGYIDGWEYDKEDFRVAKRETIGWVIDQLEKFEGYHIQYNVGDIDKFGNKLERGIFEIWNIAIHDFQLKPAHNFVKFVG